MYCNVALGHLACRVARRASRVSLSRDDATPPTWIDVNVKSLGTCARANATSIRVRWGRSRQPRLATMPRAIRTSSRGRACVAHTHTHMQDTSVRTSKTSSLRPPRSVTVLAAAAPEARDDRRACARRSRRASCRSARGRPPSSRSRATAARARAPGDVWRRGMAWRRVCVCVCVSSSSGRRGRARGRHGASARKRGASIGGGGRRDAAVWSGARAAGRSTRVIPTQNQMA